MIKYLTATGCPPFNFKSNANPSKFNIRSRHRRFQTGTKALALMEVASFCCHPERSRGNSKRYSAQQETAPKSIPKKTLTCTIQFY
jgi:hypothetical protein